MTAEQTGASELTRPRPVPDFLVIGAQRSGTTFLYAALRRHPGIVAAKTKELHYFDRAAADEETYCRQLRAHRADAKGKRRLCGEATPYYLFHPTAPERVAKVNPGVKLIALLREPGRRAWSHYHHAVRLGVEKLSFEQAMAAEPERLAGEVERIRKDPSYRSVSHQHHSYLSRGHYAEQLRAWLEFFPAGQMLVLPAEAMFRHPNRVVSAVAGFLGLPPPERRVRRWWRSRKTPQMPAETREYLDEYYRPYKECFCELIEKLDFAKTGDPLLQRVAR